MKLSEQVASHLRQLYFGENWTCVNFKEILADVDWKEATTEIYSINTIATLVFHCNYYVEAISKVLRGGILDSKDTESFKYAPIDSPQSWETLLQKMWSNAEQIADLIQELPDDKLESTFSDNKYGSYYRNLHGIIEHGHYHLGQIVLLKKIIRQKVLIETH